MSALKKKVNLKENFEMNEKFDSKFNEFLASFHPLRNILFFVDSKQTVWELVRRKDLSPSTLANKPEGIRSILSELNATNKFLAVDAEIHSPKSKLVNIEIKDIDHDRSLIASELDFSKVTDFNISMYMKEQQDIDIV